MCIRDRFGVFATFIGALALGFTSQEAASIGIIGGADGPTSIFITNKLAAHLLAPIAVAAYSHMALVPFIQPPIMRLLTTAHERKIKMRSLRKVGRFEKLVFALVVTILCILLVPDVSALIGMLMLGNFIRECGVCERLSKAAQNETIDVYKRQHCFIVWRCPPLLSAPKSASCSQTSACFLGISDFHGFSPVMVCLPKVCLLYTSFPPKTPAASTWG